MDPILPWLRRVHLLEVDPRSPSLRIDNRARGVPLLRGHVPCFERRLPRRKARGRGLQLVLEGFGPELGPAIRIRAVEHDFSLGCNDRFPARPHRPMAYLRDCGRGAYRACDLAQPKSARAFWLSVPSFPAGNWYFIIPARRRTWIMLPGPTTP